MLVHLAVGKRYVGLRDQFCHAVGDLIYIVDPVVDVIDPPVPGAHNTQVTFLHPKCTFGVLTEFCQHPGGCECGK